MLKVEGGLCFIPAPIAVRLAPTPRITSIPGAPPELLGIALHDGMVVSVLAIGRAAAGMVICQHGGELLGIVGGEVVKTGLFDVVRDQPGVVEHDGVPATTLDVAALYNRVQLGARPARWGGAG